MGSYTPRITEARLKPSNDVIRYKRPQFIDKDIDRYCSRSRKTQRQIKGR